MTLYISIMVFMVISKEIVSLFFIESSFAMKKINPHKTLIFPPFETNGIPSHIKHEERNNLLLNRNILYCFSHSKIE